MGTPPLDSLRSEKFENDHLFHMPVNPSVLGRQAGVLAQAAERRKEILAAQNVGPFVVSEDFKSTRTRCTPASRPLEIKISEQIFTCSEVFVTASVDLR